MAKSSPICEILPKYSAVIWLNFADFATFSHKIILKCLKFLRADKDWLRFVAANRKNENVPNDYDLIIGPVANDKTMPVISLYFAGIYDEEETIKRLLPQMLRDQYVFRSELALQKLIFVKAVTK